MSSTTSMPLLRTSLLVLITIWGGPARGLSMNLVDYPTTEFRENGLVTYCPIDKIDFLGTFVYVTCLTDTEKRKEYISIPYCEEVEGCDLRRKW